ncbi:hypothetical protein F5Y10DRAFT_267948 [Nemania abortiva]|nr:hypothetical protein F5Y10DRAFT_267948 [Nemania abortiva]
MNTDSQITAGQLLRFAPSGHPYVNEISDDDLRFARLLAPSESPDFIPYPLEWPDYRSKDEATRFFNPFVKHIGRSFAYRPEHAQVLPPIEFTTNYRAKGGVSNFASQAFYDNRMSEAPHKHDDPDIILVRDFLRSITNKNADGSVISLNLEGDTNESSDG